MKKILYVSLIACLSVTACKKDKNTQANSPTIGTDNGCINRVWISQSANTLSTADYANAVALFQANSLDPTRFRWFRLLRDTIVLNGTTNYYVNVRGDQYLNGMRILGTFIIHDFKNGLLDEISGDIITSTTLDTVAHLTLPQVRWLYVQQLTSGQYELDLTQYVSVCAIAELGYYDLNGGIPNTTPDLAKAWKVYPDGQDGSGVVGYFNDADGSLIGFSDGIVH